MYFLQGTAELFCASLIHKEKKNFYHGIIVLLNRIAIDIDCTIFCLIDGGFLMTQDYNQAVMIDALKHAGTLKKVVVFSHTVRSSVLL